MAQSRLSQIASHLTSCLPEVSTPESQRQRPTYHVLEQPFGTARTLRVVGIGAGMSGMNAIRTLRLHLPVGSYSHVVYEKNPEVGGTWFENRYPGCQCDIPSHNYQFSWGPNPEWSGFFSPASEIQEYLCRVCDEEEMRDIIRLNQAVSRAEWDGEEGVWRLKIRDLIRDVEVDDYCHFLLDGSGILNNWAWPKIPGLHDFNGPLVHSANWPQDFDYSGKTVGIIGNGSSGVQILPAILPDVEKIVHFVREPTWVVPSRLNMLAERGGITSEVEIDPKGRFTQQQIEKFKADPEFYKKFVKEVEEVVNGNFPITLKDTEFAKVVQGRAVEFMTHALGGDKRLCDVMIPDFPIGCRRLTPAVEYLTALRAPNVVVVSDAIAKVTPGGFLTVKGEAIKVDAIVCATGFNVSFRPRFPIIGPSGNLQDKWTTELPKAYMSCAVPGFPNFFTFLGPNAPIGHGSVFTITEHIAKYIVRVIHKCQTEGIKTIMPSSAAVDDLFEHTQTFMPRTAWSSNCISWFKNGTSDGPVTALHPGSRIHFFHMLEKFRGEDWEYEHWNPGNRFEYLGNGFSTKEEAGDTTWYLNEPDRL